MLLSWAWIRFEEIFSTCNFYVAIAGFLIGGNENIVLMAISSYRERAILWCGWAGLLPPAKTTFPWFHLNFPPKIMNLIKQHNMNHAICYRLAQATLAVDGNYGTKKPVHNESPFCLQEPYDCFISSSTQGKPWHWYSQHGVKVWMWKPKSTE